jgi:hypothetical protein
MWTKHANGISSTAHDLSGLCRLIVRKTWHFRHDWLFTPFVVVVGGKYFLPVPECLLFGWVTQRSLVGQCASLGRFRNF